MVYINNNSALLKRIADNVENVIVGKRNAIELAIIALISNGHVLLEDVPGVGKTSLVSALAKSISASFKRIQFTPDVLPSDITGFSIFNQKRESSNSGREQLCVKFFLPMKLIEPLLKPSPVCWK